MATFAAPLRVGQRTDPAERQTEVGPKPKGNTRGCVSKGKRKPPQRWHVQWSEVKVKVLLAQSCPTLCDPHELQPARLLCPWDFPGKDTGVDTHFLLQGIFPTQELKLALLHCRQILYQLSYQGRLLQQCKFP